MHHYHFRFVFAALTFVLVLAALELLATVALRLVERRVELPDVRPYVGQAVDFEALQQRFDAELGWIHRYPNTAYGERPRAQEYGRPLLTAFGDSFTRGDEVEDHETWEETLAERLQGDVFNFGVGGYGMDQALLRFERDFSRRPAPIVIFAFISGDLERCFRRYLNFHRRQAWLPMTKPRLILEDDELLMMPNPIQAPEQLIARLQERAFLEKMALEDTSYNPHRLPTLRRPYLFLLLRPSLWKAFFAPPWQEQVWQRPEGVLLAEKILLRFERGARERGALPIILHLPLHWEMDRFLKQKTVPALEVTQDICHRHELTCLFPLTSIEETPFDDLVRYFVRGVHGGHYSAEGNRWMGEYLADRLRELAPDIVNPTPVSASR